MNPYLLLAQTPDASSDGVLDKIHGWLAILGPAGPWILAIAIIILGYFVAKIIRKIVESVLRKTSLDDKLSTLLGREPGGSEKGVGAFVFYLLMLFVVVIAMSAAGLDEAVEPLKNILDKILAALPKVLAAGAILFVAWVIATVVRQLLEGLLGAARVDERLELGESEPIKTGVGMVAFFGVLLLMLPAALGQLEMDEISVPISQMVDKILAYAPRLFGGVILFAIGYLIASIVQKVLAKILGSIGADRLPARLGFQGEALIAGKPLSAILSYLAMATILVIIGAEAIKTMGLGFISELADSFVPGYFRILAAVVIVCIGLFVANLVSQLIEPKSALWAKVVRIAILVFVGAVALQKANISALTDETFQLLIHAAIVASAFAGGVGGAIAIGLGGREKAKSLLEKVGK